MRISLQDKFYGCILGAHIGSAMGAAVEGWPHSVISEKYGVLDKLTSYEHYENGWVREPGTTEDGIERQKMMITAIMEKQERICAEDLRKIWIRDMHPKAPGGISEPFEGELLAFAKTKIPARDIGKYCDYAGLNSFSRACHPIGLINAGNVKDAIYDVFEVGQLYQTSNSRGLKWACVTAVAIAAATLPGATVDSVLQAVFDNLGEREKIEGRDDDWNPDYAGMNVIDEIKQGLELTKNCIDFREMSVVFDGVYNGFGMPYCMSYANEVVVKGICIFKMVNGNLKDAIISAVNMGRDTDCLAAVAAGISGALDGSASVPKEWIEQVDYATSIHKFTTCRRTMRENADGLYDAFKARLAKMKQYAALMEEV